MQEIATTANEIESLDKTAMMHAFADLIAEKVGTWKPKTTLTVRDLFVHYFEGHAKEHCRTADWMQANFDRYFGTIQGVNAYDLKPLDVQHWHIELGNTKGEPTANRQLQLLKAVYNYADKLDLIQCRNPVRAVARYKEYSRRRFVDAKEMPRLLRAIEEHGTFWTKDIFLLCLYTGQRLRNVCSMKWENIDWDSATWHIPASEFKTGEALDLPLVPEAIEILKARRNSYDYVFPSRRDKTKHIDYPYNGWRKVLKASKIENLRLHDLRRTNATWQATLGSTLTVIGRSLGHRSLQTTQKVYALAEDQAVRKSLDAVARAISGRTAEPEQIEKTRQARRNVKLECEPRPLTPRFLNMARKIIEAIEAGKTSKKMFYSKIGRISSLELDSVLDQMVAQKMIRRYQAETGYWHYSN